MKNKKLERIILKKIESGEVKMKPEWKFRAVDKGIKGTFLIILLLAVGSVLGVVYFIREYRPWELAELGEVGRQLIIEDFPYQWLIAGSLMVALLSMVLRMIGDNYRKEDREIWAISIAMVIILATLVQLAKNLL